MHCTGLSINIIYMVLRFNTTASGTRVELHTAGVRTMTHPYAVQDHRPPRLIYPDHGREEIITGVGITMPDAYATISPRHPDLERDMTHNMPRVQRIAHEHQRTVLLITYPDTANVVIAGYRPVTSLYLIFDRRENGIPTELGIIRLLGQP